MKLTCLRVVVDEAHRLLTLRELLQLGLISFFIVIKATSWFCAYSVSSFSPLTSYLALWIVFLVILVILVICLSVEWRRLVVCYDHVLFLAVPTYV
jgi:hypothetical protein